METTNSKALQVVTVESVHTTEEITEDLKILQNLNLTLQIKNHNLENENKRLKQEIQNYEGRNVMYDAQSQYLADLRRQCDKTSIALLRKCEAYNNLMKENLALKSQIRVSPQGAATPLRSMAGSPKAIVRKKIPIFDQSTDYSSSDDDLAPRRTGRPSMGSCGNITDQITDEETIPSKLKSYARPNAALRNRVLLKLHSMKSASTESLESTGRKSLKASEKEKENPKKKVPTAKVPSKVVPPSQKVKPESNSTKLQRGKTYSTPSNKPLSNSTKTGISRVHPSCRPALGEGNAHLRQVRINPASVARSNSNCSTKSTTSNASTSKPGFRF